MEEYSLRQLKIFKSVYESGSTAKAGKELGVTQSGISRALTHLEKIIGFQLFIRRKNRLLITPESTEFYHDVQILLSDLDQINHNISALQKFGASRVRIGAIPGLSFGFLPRILSDLIREHSDISVYFDILSSNEVVRGVERGKLDIGFVTLPVQRRNLYVKSLISTEAVCVLPANHSLASLPFIKLADLALQNLIFANQPNIDADQLLDLFDDSEIVPGRQIESNIGSICSLVANQVGLTIINPITAMDMADPDKTVTKAFQPTIQYNFGIVTKSSWANSKIVLFLKERIQRLSQDSKVFRYQD